MRTGDAVKIRLHDKTNARVPDAVFDVYIYLPHRWATDRGLRSPAHIDAGGVSPDAAG